MDYLDADTSGPCDSCPSQAACDALSEEHWLQQWELCNEQGWYQFEPDETKRLERLWEPAAVEQQSS